MASLPGSDTAILVLSYGSDLHNLYADTSKQNAARFRSKWPRSKKNSDADDFSPPSISKYEKGGLVFAQDNLRTRFFLPEGQGQNYGEFARGNGRTRPRVSFFMNKFSNLGFIDYDRTELRSKILRCDQF